MNKVSWFLYAAEVVGNLGAGATGVLIVGGIFGGGATAVVNGIAYAENEGLKPTARSMRRWYFSVMTVSSLLAAFVPSKNTMYAIAVSEFGEQVLKSEELKGVSTDAKKALRAWINRQIEPENTKK